MAIVNHPRLRFEDDYGGSGVAKVVRCDACGELARGAGRDCGDAAEAARKSGFRTVSVGLTEPKLWNCGCRKDSELQPPKRAGNGRQRRNGSMRS